MTGPAVQGRTPGGPAPASPVPAAPVPPRAAGTLIDDRPCWQRWGEDIDWPLIPWFVCAHSHIEPRDYLAERNRCSDCGLVLIR